MQRMLIVATLVALCGCSSDSTSPTKVAKVSRSGENAETDAIRTASERFLSSVVDGNADEAIRWLTPSAAKRVSEDPSVFAPLGFPVSSLEVAEVRIVAENEAAAQCWLSEAGAEEPEEICCLLKKSAQGWRVCGIACNATPGMQPTVISFEPQSQQPQKNLDPSRFVSEPSSQGFQAASGPPETIRR